jgi:hypothetical protein
MLTGLATWFSSHIPRLLLTLRLLDAVNRHLWWISVLAGSRVSQQSTKKKVLSSSQSRLWLELVQSQRLSLNKETFNRGRAHLGKEQNMRASVFQTSCARKLTVQGITICTTATNKNLLSTSMRQTVHLEFCRFGKSEVDWSLSEMFPGHGANQLNLRSQIASIKSLMQVRVALILCTA